MTRNRHSRRAFLSSLGASAAFLPVLNQDAAHGAPTAFPTRVVVVYWTNGVQQEAFWLRPGLAYLEKQPPADIMSEFTTPTCLEPLRPFESKIIVPQGVALSVNYEREKAVGGHDVMPLLLTGVDCVTEATADGGVKVVGAGGISIDQYIAQQLNAPTRFPSLELAMMVGTSNLAQGRISWSGRNAAVTPFESPYDVFGRLFSDRLKSHADVQADLTLDKSILDHVERELSRYQAKLSGDDKRKIDAHLEAVRGLERQLTSAGTNQSCTVTPLGSRLDAQNISDYPVIGKLQMDVLAQALACDVTRVATLQWSNGANDHLLMPWMKDAGLGIESLSHHTVAHWNSPDSNDSNELRSARKIAVDRWFVEQFAYLLTKLSSYQEGDGTLLDHCAVVFVNGMNNGGIHDSAPLPLVLAGSANGQWRTGRYTQLGGLSANQVSDKRDFRELLVGLCDVMNVPRPSFQGRSFDPLPNLS